MSAGLLVALALALAAGAACVSPSTDCDTDADCPGRRCVDGSCTAVRCGDGIRGGVERCDLGPRNGVEGSGCDAACVEVSCGNGVVEPERGEECEPSAGDPDCRADCRLHLCGDGRQDPGEACDPPQEDGSCVPGCAAPVCGDGFVSTAIGERCDDGNDVDDDGCESNCQCARIVQLCGGDAFFAFLDQAGGVWVTGQDPVSLQTGPGRLGGGPTRLPDDRRVERISCGMRSLARFDGRGVRFDSVAGASGRGPLAPTTRAEDGTITLPDGSAIEALVASDSHVLVLDGQRRIWSWGPVPTSGQPSWLGRDGPATTPALVAAQGATFRSVAVAVEGSYAVRDDGQVVSFGANTYGQLGLGLAASELESTSTPTTIEGLSCCDRVHAGGHHAFAECRRLPGARPGEGRCEEGGQHHVWGFGEDYYGALGNGVMVGRPDVCDVRCEDDWGVSYGPEVCRTDAGYADGCALHPLAVPELVRGDDARLTLLAAGSHTVVLDASGAVSTFGMTRFGCSCPQPGSNYCASAVGLGDTECMARERPDEHPMRWNGAPLRAVGGAAARRAMAVVVEDGRVFVTGEDEGYKLGLPEPSGRVEACRYGCAERCTAAACSGGCGQLCGRDEACSAACNADCVAAGDGLGPRCVELCLAQCDGCVGGEASRLELTELFFCPDARGEPATIPGDCSP